MHTLRPGTEPGKGSSLRSLLATELMDKRPAIASQAPTRGRFAAGGLGSSCGLRGMTPNWSNEGGVVGLPGFPAVTPNIQISHAKQAKQKPWAQELSIPKITAHVIAHSITTPVSKSWCCPRGQKPEAGTLVTPHGAQRCNKQPSFKSASLLRRASVTGNVRALASGSIRNGALSTTQAVATL